MLVYIRSSAAGLSNWLNYRPSTKSHSFWGPPLDGPGLESRKKQETVFFSTKSITSLEPTQPPIKWVPEHCPRTSHRGVILNTHLYLSQSLRSSGAVHLLLLTPLLLRFLLLLRGVERNYTFTSTNHPDSLTPTVQVVVAFTVGIFRTKEHHHHRRRRHHHHHHHHHHHTSVMELGHLLTRFGLTYPELSSKVYHDFFCQLESCVN